MREDLADIGPGRLPRSEPERHFHGVLFAGHEHRPCDGLDDGTGNAHFLAARERAVTGPGVGQQPIEQHEAFLRVHVVQDAVVGLHITFFLSRTTVLWSGRTTLL